MENTNTIQFQNDHAAFFIARGDTHQGPFKAQEIYSMLKSGEATWIDYIYREQEGQWLRVADHPVFKPLQAEPPKPKPKVTMPPPVPKAEPEVQWFLFQNDTQTGPYPASELLRLISSGQVLSSAFVWQEKFTEWKPFQDVAELKVQKATVSVKPEAPKDRRTAPRKPLVAQIYLTNQKDIMTAICRDISVGGMQVLSEQVPGKVGDQIRLNVLPPPETKLKPFVAEGVLVRVLEDGRGFSFRFSSLSPEAKAAIESYIA